MGVVSASPNTRILVDGFDLSGFVNAADANFKQESQDARTFNSTGPRNVPGNYDHNHKLTAFWDGDPLQSDEIMYGMLASDADHYYAELWGANAVGSRVYESIVKLNTNPIKGQTGQLIAINGEFIGNGPVSRGFVLANTTATATGTYTGIDSVVGAATAITTAQTYQSVVRLLNGTSNSSISVTVDIEEASASGAPYTTMVGMTATLTQVGVTRLTSTGGSKKFKRARISAINLSTGTTGLNVIVTGGLVST